MPVRVLQCTSSIYTADQANHSCKIRGRHSALAEVTCTHTPVNQPDKRSDDKGPAATLVRSPDLFMPLAGRMREKREKREERSKIVQIVLLNLNR